MLPTHVLRMQSSAKQLRTGQLGALPFATMWSIKSAAIGAVVLWVIMLIYLSSQLFGIQNKAPSLDTTLSLQLSEALDSMRELRKQNQELKELIEAERKEHFERNKELQKKDEKLQRAVIAEKKELPSKGDDLYSKDHEIARRHLDRGVWEIFYLLHKRFKTAPGKWGNHSEEQLISLLAASYNLSDVDNAESWRKGKLQKLTNEIQSRIDKLQNPDECSKTRALLCNLDKECGFGCQMHHVAYCFVTAFGAQRTMVLNHDGNAWRYSSHGWTGAFKPITKCSFDQVMADDVAATFAPNSPARVVALGIVDALTNRPEHLPLSFPKSMADDMLKLHSNPPAFFVSQFIWYMMRSNDVIKKVVEHAESQIPFGKGPIVGLQVRRTDKVGTEAAFHSVEEYMEWTEIWFKIQERRRGQPIKRKVYIASDDPQVVPETKKKYPKYEVFGDIQIANTAQLGSRYTDASLHGVITDIRLLSQCDYLVCTMSSQVCRMGYELMQVLQGDVAENFHSLDDLYYYGGQFAHEQVAIESHEAESKDEISFKTGDVIGIAGNHWDGYSKGQNRRTKQMGLYPSYKAVEKWRIVDFPGLV